MVKKLITFSILHCCIVCACAQKTNINLSNGIIFDAEPYIALNPINHNNIVVAWMGFVKTEVAIKTRASFDGGKTWTVANPLPHFGKNWHSADVSMAFDRNGILFLTYIDYRQAPDSGGVYVVQSVDSGKTWSLASLVFGAFETTKRAIDRPWLAVDNKGILYVTTKPAPWIPAPNRPYLKFSVDSGKTWSKYRFVDTTGSLVGNIIQAPMAAPCVSLGGRLNMVYPSYLASQSLYPQYFLASSYNHGYHINYNTVFAGVVGLGDTLYKAGYSLCASPVDSSKMAFAFTGKINTDADIYVLNSKDGGNNWIKTPVRVNDDSINNGKWQDMVWANYDTSGNLWVTWRDRRLSPGKGFINQGTDVYGALSKDNGSTFGKNIRLSDTTATYDSILKKNGNDFLCNAIYGDTAYTVWSDTRSRRLNVYFVKTCLSTALSVRQIIAQEPGLTFKIVPVYAARKLRIIGDMNTHCEGIVRLFDLEGRLIFSKTINYSSATVYVNMPQIAGGIYVVDISCGGAIYSQKIFWGE